MQSDFAFCSGSVPLSYTKSYKYLRFTLDDHLTYIEGVNVLLDSAGRALGAVLNKVKFCKDLGYKTYTQLFKSYVPFWIMEQGFGAMVNISNVKQYKTELYVVFWEYINWPHYLQFVVTWVGSHVRYGMEVTWYVCGID